MLRIAPARKAAFRILLAVEGGPDHADDLLRGDAVNALDAADRDLAAALVLGALRWQLWLDARLRPLLKRPNAKLDAEVRLALRLGALQLRFFDRIPAHAAIDESVELTKQSGHRFAAGMVNAVLRSFAGAAAAAARGGLLDQRIDEIAAHPAWMVARWTAAYGPEVAAEICHHGQSQPRLTVRLGDTAVGDTAIEEELRGEGVELAPGALLAAARTVAAGDVTATAAFRSGRVRTQDEGSQWVAELASCTALVQSKKNILDACAAPGGKTLILAERNPQARILACEANPKRFAALRKRLAAYADRVECRLADAAALAEEAAFDLALVDAPCSGTGTMGRNPEIRHRLRPEGLPRLAARQQAILCAALRAVRPGGRVVYSTCSLEPEENQQVVAAALAENTCLRQLSLAPWLDALDGEGVLAPGAADRLRSCITAEGALRLLPGVLRTDGFFVALIERTA